MGRFSSFRPENLDFRVCSPFSSGKVDRILTGRSRFTYFLTLMGLSSSFFFPSIVVALRFNIQTDTLLLTALPWIWVMLVSPPNVWNADRTGERFFHYLWPRLLTVLDTLSL
jgi:hypothetical protein